MSSELRQFVSHEFCEIQILFNICGSFCCHFEIVVLKKDFMMFKTDAK